VLKIVKTLDFKNYSAIIKLVQREEGV